MPPFFVSVMPQNRACIYAPMQALYILSAALIYRANP